MKETDNQHDNSDFGISNQQEYIVDGKVFEVQSAFKSEGIITVGSVLFRLMKNEIDR